MFKKLCVPRAVHIKNLSQSSGLWNAMDLGEEQGIGREQVWEQRRCYVCCHLPAPPDSSEIKCFGAVSSFGKLAEHFSHSPPCPHKELPGSSLSSLNISNHCD